MTANTAPAPMPPDAYRHLQWLFSWHLLTVRQKLMTLAQKYTVHDEQDYPRFHVVRPPKIALSLVAGAAALSVSLLSLYFGIRMMMNQGEFVVAMAIIVGGGMVARLVRVLLMPYRDIRVFADAAEQFPVMTISQDNKFGLHHWYTVIDAMGNPVARAKRNLLTAIWRRQWVAETLDGRPILNVREDSLGLALLRRYVGSLWGMLRTNFDFYIPGGPRVGEYNRKLTITDQYVMDLRADPWFLVDRRVALALAILLDTGEGR